MHQSLQERLASLPAEERTKKAEEVIQRIYKSWREQWTTAEERQRRRFSSWSESYNQDVKEATQEEKRKIDEEFKRETLQVTSNSEEVVTAISRLEAINGAVIWSTILGRVLGIAEERSATIYFQVKNEEVVKRLQGMTPKEQAKFLERENYALEAAQIYETLGKVKKAKKLRTEYLDTLIRLNAYDRAIDYADKFGFYDKAAEFREKARTAKTD